MKNKIHLLRDIPAVLFLLLGQSLSAQVTGTVFRDFNGNGMKDANEPFVSGVTVNAYLANSATPCGTATTSGNTAPNYTLSGCGTSAVRVEFVLPSSGTCVNSSIDFSSLSGTTYGSSVQFVNGNSTNVNFALHNPNDYNQGTSNVSVFVPCYVNGDPLPAGSTSGALEWFIGFPYTSSGTSTSPAQKLTGEVIGSTWGVAYSKQANRVFTSAFLKRHVGLGRMGTGGIYMLEPTPTSFNVTEFYDMDFNGHNTRATSGTYGVGTSFTIDANNEVLTFIGNGLGVVGSNSERGLDVDPLIPNWDPAAHDQVGKVGLGDLEISDDGRYLFVVNLYTRLLYRLELNNANNPTSIVNVTSYPIPDPGCNNGTYRPFALKFYRNKLYIGVVCSAENNGTASDLGAYVYEMTDPTGAAAINNTPIINFPLDYTRQMNEWDPWSNNADNDGDESPMLSDIEFSDRGDLILGFMSRAGHQFGFRQYQYLANSTATVTVSTEGEILIAGVDCSGTYSLENNGSFTSNGATISEGHSRNGGSPGGMGNEFFDDNAPTGDPHDEVAVGSLAQLKGTGEIFMTAFAIFNTVSSDAGTMKLSTNNGTYVSGSGYLLYATPTGTPFLGKANGLGDSEISGVEAPIEIGNRVWMDTNNDGIQGADEMGIGSVPVKLYQGATEVGATTTAANGTYYFNNSNVNLNGATGLLPNTAYVIRVDAADFPSGKSLSAIVNVGGAGQPDVRDNDAALNAGNAEISVTTGNYGANNHTLDMAFVACITPTATAAATQPTCSGGVAQSNGTITISGFTAGQRYQYSSGATFNSGAATPVAITAIPMSGVITSTLPNTTQQYTVRIYDAVDDACFVDRVVSMTAVNFTTSSTVPACHANGTPEDASDDYMTFSINVANSKQGSLTYTVTATQGGNPIVVTLADGSPATAVNCNLNTPLRTPAGSAGDGPIVLTITDNVHGCTTTMNIADPGTCAVTCVPGTPSMVMYTYATQVQVTELVDVPIILPQFDDQGGTRTLTSVTLEYGSGGYFSALMESNSAVPVAMVRVTSTTDSEIELNGNILSTFALSATSGFQSLPVGISVPPQGTWPGDDIVNNSTIEAMRPWAQGLMSNLKDPRLDPRWVTTATGNNTHDDDIYFLAPTLDEKMGTVTYTNPVDLVPFQGTGNVPLEVTTLSGFSTTGGGGFISAFQATRGYAFGKVTYTYECAAACVNPTHNPPTSIAGSCTGGTPNIDATITVTGIANADRIGISTGATYSGTPAYAAATPVAGAMHIFNGLMHNTQYTIRLFNGGDNCFTDVTVTSAGIACLTHDKTGPVIGTQQP
ncbi:MAG: choice-of-anchor E domain-containing protein, partial [Saprospiraceae bacterium]|nr:choice-of-anchor E domain-containing protein [Saprospiraceae bacterium]